MQIDSKQATKFKILTGNGLVYIVIKFDFILVIGPISYYIYNNQVWDKDKDMDNN